MMKEKLYRCLDEQILIFDGAMGTMLFAKGLKAGVCPESFNVEHEDIVLEIHKEYIQAGANIIQTNTFGGNTMRLKTFGMDDKMIEINQRAVDIALRAAADRCLVAGNMGPVGKPWDAGKAETIYQTFYQQAKVLIEEGVELMSIETMTDLREAVLALKAVKSIKAIPVICSMSFVKDLKSLDGSTPEMASKQLRAEGADIIGTNCGSNMEDMLTVMEKMIGTGGKYWSVKPNAGFPKKIGNQMSYPLTAKDMGYYGRKFAELGANIIGGCCGTTPAYIQSIHEALESLK